MKRYGNLFEKICNEENIRLAHQNARRGKSFYNEVKMVDSDIDRYVGEIKQMLESETFKCSHYEIFERKCGKKIREIYKLPYYPDRIIQHAIIQVLEPIWMTMFINDTFSCIKGRGIHYAASRVKKAMRDENGTKYCLKIDIKKYYPSIDNDILKAILQKKIKCQKTLDLLYGIIDSAQGVPIGNYLSQHFANIYLTYFDHYIKEHCGVKYYFRYCDDMVILHSDKAFLHGLLVNINHYLTENLNLTIKQNYQVFPVESRGVDFVGYRFFHGFTLLRKSIKAEMIKKLKTDNPKSAASYYGWLKHGNCFNLRTKYTKKYENLFRHAS